MHSHECAVASAGGQFFIVWTEQQKGGKSLILGRIIQNWYPSKTTIVIASARDSISPQVAYNPARAEYMVVYQTRTSSMVKWLLDGTRVNTLGDIIGTEPITTVADVNEHCKAPDVAYNWADGQYIVAWAQSPLDKDAPLASHRIWARRVEGSGKPLDKPIAISEFGKDQLLSQ
jgi:hypothetical protein